MTTIQNFDKSNLNQIRKDMELALAGVSSKYGVHFNLGNIRFSPDNFRMKVECNIPGAAGSSTTTHPPTMGKVPIGYSSGQDAVLAMLLGCKTEELKSYKIRIKGKSFFLAGYKPRARKNNILIIDPSTDREYVTSTNTAIQCRVKPVTA